MNITKERDGTFWFRLYSLVGAVFSIGITSYFVVPMLPIYCVDSIAQGGLGWTRSDACALYGTFIAVAHIAPFVAGFFADFLFGRYVSVFMGYACVLYGLALLWLFPDTMLMPGLLLFAFGSGSVKVSLAVAVGQLCSGQFSHHRTRGYECHYYMSCLGFIAGNFLANLFYNFWGMKALFLCCLGTASMSLVSYLLCRPKSLQGPSEHLSEGEKSVQTATLPAAITIGMLAIGVLFFMCGNQLNSSISLFLHEQVDRTICGWNMPTLWFSVFGFVVMVALSSVRTRLWKPFQHMPFLEPIKMAVGLALLSGSFFLFACTSAFSGVFGSGATLVLIFLAMSVLFVADVHVRPLLFASATKFSSPKYHTIASAVVYSMVGIGGKLAGTLAGMSESIGYSWLFSACAMVGGISGLLALVLWRRQVGDRNVFGENNSLPVVADGSFKEN